MAGNSRKVVKLERRKSLVIAAGGDLAEIPPTTGDHSKWRNLKMGSPEVMILENTFSKVVILENTFREILVKS